MPRTVIDYQKTIMYKFVCNDLTIPDVYVGGTTDFTKRKSMHRAGCTKESNRAYHYNVYEFMRNNGGWSNWTMIEIEKYPCNDGNESRARERHWIETLNATLNKVIPGRTRVETSKAYRDDHKDEIKAQSKIYKDAHYEEITARKQEYNKNNRDKINAAQRALRLRKKEPVDNNENDDDSDS